MTADEQRLFRLYGKLPNRKDLLQNKLKVNPPFPYPFPSSPPTTPTNTPSQERKYFDSGDYALSKAGKASDIGVTSIGREHPDPEKIPHMAMTPPPVVSGNQNGAEKGSLAQGSNSPVKEGTFLHRETTLNRETSVDDIGDEEEKQVEGSKA
jgi:hypothetical protein